MSTPFRIRQILFPTDFSTSSEAAAQYVARFAKEIAARVSLVHVLAWLPAWRGASESYYSNLEAKALRDLEAQQAVDEEAACIALAAFKERYFPDVETVACIKSGGVTDSIIEHATDIGADLVMMPTRGLGPLRRFLIGSTTAKVLHDLQRPLWTTPHVKELEQFSPWQHVVCAMDYRTLTPDLLLRAKGVAEIFGSRLTVVSAIPFAGRTAVHTDHASIHPLKREVTASIKAMLSELNVQAGVEVLEGSAGEIVSEEAALEDADLIVIGQGHLDKPMGHLRTHAYEIIWNAPCPVLKI